jgi:isoamylase
MKKPKTVGADATVIDGTRGNSFPLGATVTHGGINFSVYSKNAEAVELLLFEHAEDSGPSRIMIGAQTLIASK